MVNRGRRGRDRMVIGFITPPVYYGLAELTSDKLENHGSWTLDKIRLDIEI